MAETVLLGVARESGLSSRGIYRRTDPLATMLSGRLTTQAQRPGARDATIATAMLSPGSLQRMVSRHLIECVGHNPQSKSSRPSAVIQTSEAALLLRSAKYSAPKERTDRQ